MNKLLNFMNIHYQILGIYIIVSYECIIKFHYIIKYLIIIIIMLFNNYQILNIISLFIFFK